MDKFAFVPFPQSEESFSGWLERLAGEYDCAPAELLDYLPASTYSPQIDTDVDLELRPRVKAALAYATDIATSNLDRMHLGFSWYLHRSLRTVMCPLCWLSELAAGHAPHYRKAWASPVAMICPVHNCFLMDYSRGRTDPRNCRVYFTQNSVGLEVQGLVGRFLLIQDLFYGHEEEAALLSIRGGVLRDLITLVATNFLQQPRWGAAMSMYDGLKLRCWRLPWDQIMPVPCGRPTASAGGEVQLIDFENVTTVGLRRLYLLCALMALPGVLRRNQIGYHDCFTDKALDWIDRRSRYWQSDEISLLMPVAQKVAL